MKIKILTSVGDCVAGDVLDAVLSPSKQCGYTFKGINESAWYLSNYPGKPAQFEILPEERPLITMEELIKLKGELAGYKLRCAAPDNNYLPGKAELQPPFDAQGIIHNFSLIDVIGAEPEAITIKFKPQ